MANQLEETEIPVSCSGCGNNTLTSIRRLRDRHQVDCGVCGEEVNLDNQGFRDAILDAEKSIARVSEEFRDPAS